jgi:hypothetical protein
LLQRKASPAREIGASGMRLCEKFIRKGSIIAKYFYLTHLVIAALRSLRATLGLRWNNFSEAL